MQLHANSSPRPFLFSEWRWPKGEGFHAPLLGILASPMPSVSEYSRPRALSRQSKKAKHIFANQGIFVPIIVDASHRIIDEVLWFEMAKDLGLEHLHAIVFHNPRPDELTQLELALN